MSRLQIPYDRVLLNPTDFDPADFDGILRRFIGMSGETHIVIEIFNDYSQMLLFVREGQLYWACVGSGDRFESITIRDFFGMLQRSQFPQIIAYSVNLVLYHSLLVYLQNKPELKISSSLVDLDDLLDRTETEHGNALVTALQPGNFIMLRYKDGKALACYHSYNMHKDVETDKREEFLVKVYTLATKALFEVNLFTDLVVTHSEDAKHVPSDYSGSVASYFMSQPPKIIVRLKNRPLKTYTFTGKQLTIGRLPENDIVIDNLSVSRKHAVIHAWKTGYHIKDLGSKNGTFLGGSKIDSAELHDGDNITIGKYHILFQIPAPDEPRPVSMDQTVIIPNFKSAVRGGARPDARSAGPAPEERAATSQARLYRRSDHEEFVLGDEKTVIGRGKESHIRLRGLMAPRVTVEISRSGGDYVLQKTEGRRDVNINGESMTEKVLEEEDLIAIGPEEFVFKR